MLIKGFFFQPLSCSRTWDQEGFSQLSKGFCRIDFWPF